MVSVSLVLGGSLAHAEEDPDPYTYTIAGGDGTIYPHADDACQAAYQADIPKVHQAAPDTNATTTKILPFESPTVNSTNSNPPTLMVYDCYTKFQLISNSDGSVAASLQFSHLIYGQQKETPCPDGQVKNQFTGKCENPSEDQARKETGDPLSAPLGGVITCAGNPISISTGNKFQEEEDFRDSNGELVFKRYYNGITSGWTHSYGMTLDTNGNTLLLTSDDGRSSIFTLTNGVPVGEATEQGSLQKVNGQWVYAAPDNVIYTFDTMGLLVRKQLADGRAQTITYAIQSPGKFSFTVTDSGGRQLQFVTSWYRGPLESLTANGLSITYTNGAQNLLAQATKSWGDHTTTRAYVYEDTVHPKLLTGIIDERGARFATWHYDSQGRGISSEHANGAGKVTLAYQDDGSVVVTNSLGHSVTYRYQVIQGIKRVTAIEGEPAAGCPASNTKYTYTARGQVETKTDALGTVTAYEYDALGRETKRVEAKGTPQERVTITTWDAVRFLPLTVSTPDRVTTYTYDDQGRLLSSSGHAFKE
jgi:YD repeat-containing protein